MQKIWLEKSFKYDGSQLSPLYNYLQHGPLGNSIVGWRGACDIPFEHMIDGEDIKDSAQIAGDDMLHFVLEMFDFPLSSAVSFQRLMGGILQSLVSQKSPQAKKLVRKGDDLYLSDQKFNISIATCSANSSLIHFGFNVSNAGTPVATCSLEDFSIKNISEFGKEYMELVSNEYESIRRATMKVRSF